MNPSLERLGYCQRRCRPDGLPRRNWMKAGAEILFWFWFYQYAAPTALGTNAVPKSFCVGRLGHLAFEFNLLTEIGAFIRKTISAN